MKSIIIILIFFGIGLSAIAQVETAKRWTKTYNSGQRDVAVKSICDSYGNLYVAGYKSLTGTRADSTARMLLIKYNSAGEMEWQKTFQSRNGRRTAAWGLDIDDSGNVVICGTADTLSYNISRSLIVKYNPAGDTLWARYHGVNLYPWIAYDVKTDSEGNIYIAEELEVTNPMPGKSCYVVKFSSSGMFQWMSQAIINSTAPFIEVNSFNSIFMGSSTIGTGGGDIRIINIDNSGTQQWGVTYNSPANAIDQLRGLKCDPVSGDLIAVATAQQSVTMAIELQTMKFSTGLGQLMWVKRTAGTLAGSSNTLEDLAVSPSGEVYICGSYENTNTGMDGYLIKYNSSGNEIYRKTYNHNGGNTAEGISSVDIGASGEPLVSGYRVSVKNIFIHKYSSNGSLVWKYSYNDSMNSFDEAPVKIVRSTGSKIYCVVNYYTPSLNDINTTMFDDITVNRLSICRNFNTSTIAGDYIYDTVNVNTGMNKLTRIEVKIDSLVHSNPKDLIIKLKAPSGVVKDVFKNSGLTGQSTGMYGTVLTDTASKTIDSGSVTYSGYFTPFEPLEIHNSYIPDGNWILMVYNTANGDTGIVKKWCLNVIYEAPVGVHLMGSETPKSYKLSQNYPNPFNPVTNIKFSIPKSGKVTLKVFDILGREAAELVNEFKTAGNYLVDFNASNLSSGVYFYRIETNEFTDVRKMILVK